MSLETTRLTGRRPSRPRWIVLIFAIVIGLGVGIGTEYAFLPTQPHVTADSEEPAPAPETNSPAPEPEPTPEPPEPEPPAPVSFTVAAAGDVLLHEPVHASARSGNTYDFNPLLENIDHLVGSAGVALCHMEVPLLAEGQAISGYPMFGSSRQIALDLKTRGWDGCSTASNHSVDRAFAGIETTIATQLADSGEVDPFVGHHPHVPQPITLLDGGPDQRGMWTAYSLGNFLSNQGSQCCVAQTSNGLMMFAHIVNDHENPPYLEDVSWRALTVDRLGKHTVYDLSQAYTEGTGVGSLSAAEITTRYGLVSDVVGDEAPELDELPEFTGTVTADRRAAASAPAPEGEGDVDASEEPADSDN